MHLICFDDARRDALLPLTFTRPVADLRIGMHTIAEQWVFLLKSDGFSFFPHPDLRPFYPVATNGAALVINGALLPDENLAGTILELGDDEVLIHGNDILALKCTNWQDDCLQRLSQFKTKEFQTAPTWINRPSDIFLYNGAQITKEFTLRCTDKPPADPGTYCQIIGNELFIEEGAEVSACTINTSNGPVYIGKEAVVMEGALIRGPVAIMDHSVVKMGARIYGDTTIGPHSKVGGEISNSVFHSCSNKAHDGFLGNSVIGAWCNLGADTNTSNLKNNYGHVIVWNYGADAYEDTGLQFHGLIMGDHSKCSINTMFNTGAVVGVFANIFGADFPPKFVPSFSWGAKGKWETYRFEKACEVAKMVMKRRGIDFTDQDRALLKMVFDQTGKYRGISK